MHWNLNCAGDGQGVAWLSSLNIRCSCILILLLRLPQAVEATTLLLQLFIRSNCTFFSSVPRHSDLFTNCGFHERAQNTRGCCVKGFWHSCLWLCSAHETNSVQFNIQLRFELFIYSHSTACCIFPKMAIDKTQLPRKGCYLHLLQMFT